MTKPSLPPQVVVRLPEEIVTLIYSYVPHFRKSRKPSPSLQRALETLQKSPKRTAMDMYGYDDFVLC